MFALLAEAYHLVIPLTIGAIGILVMGLGRFLDRLTGACRTPRCPGCWYELSGLPPASRMLCPECGKVVGDRVHRSRSRRLVIAGGVLLTFVGVTIAPVLSLGVAQEPTWLLVRHRVAADGFIDQDVNAELQARQAAGSLSRNARARMLAEALLHIRQMAGTELPANSDRHSSQFRSECVWVALFAVPESSDDPVAEWLASENLSLQRASLYLMAVYAHQHKADMPFPAAWIQPYERVLQGGQHEGYDVAPLFASDIRFGMKATDTMNDLVVRRALDVALPDEVRLLALSALEPAIRTRDARASAVLCRLAPLLLAPGRVQANTLHLAARAGPEAAALLREELEKAAAGAPPERRLQLQEIIRHIPSG